MILFGKIGDMKKSSLTFFIQYGVEVGTLGNEKDKEEEYLVGVARVNKSDLVEKVLRLGLSCTSFSFSFSLLVSLGLVLYAGRFGKETSGMKSIWCLIPLRGGKPLEGS